MGSPQEMLKAGWVLCSLTLLVLLRVGAGMPTGASQPDSACTSSIPTRTPAKARNCPTSSRKCFPKAHKAFGLG